MRILFVCLGNICRSPLAEGILKKKLESRNLLNGFTVDSVGFEPFHTGDHPDPRSIAVAQKNGINISKHIARLFQVADFDRFDRIYVMDNNNYRDVHSMARNSRDMQKVDFILNIIDPGSNRPVPDPWYGRQNDFEKTFHLLDMALEMMVESLQKTIS